MDYIIGFLLGYFVKEVSTFIKRISGSDWDNRNYYKKSYKWIDLEEDDFI